MVELLALSLPEMQALVEKGGFPKFHAKQIMDYIYKRHVFVIEEMMQLPQNLREWLKEEATISVPKILSCKETSNGDTIKLLVELTDGSTVETVLMKHDYGNSVCVSSQVGCAMGCKFCASTREGRLRNLEAYEIVAQVLLHNFVSKEPIHSIVVMGAGEPMENYDHVIHALRLLHEKETFNLGYRRMTISTCGLTDGIYRLAEEGLPITLALSLHAPNDEKRRQIMPIANRYDLRNVLKAMAHYFANTGRKLTFEYILIDGFNASREDAEELALLLQNCRTCNINLIPVNGNEHMDMHKPSAKAIRDFSNALEKKGYAVVVRKEMGDEIQAACGQLKVQYDKKSNQ